jgi:hypothetical protein
VANLPLVKVAQGLTAAILNGIIDRVNRQALTGIVPGSVDSGGGTVTVAANGMISFTNATNVFVSQAFTGDFANYRFVWNSSTRSAAQSIQFRHTTGGTEWTSPTYAWLRRQDQGTAVEHHVGDRVDGVPDRLTRRGGPVIGRLPGPVRARGRHQRHLHVGPRVDVRHDERDDAGAGLRPEHAGASVRRVQPVPTSGTFTGSLRIYGYNNLV